MNDLIRKINLSKICKVFRVIKKTSYIVMSEKRIGQSIRMQFKTHTSYANINNLKPALKKKKNHGVHI